MALGRFVPAALAAGLIGCQTPSEEVLADLQSRKDCTEVVAGNPTIRVSDKSRERFAKALCDPEGSLVVIDLDGDGYAGDNDCDETNPGVNRGKIYNKDEDSDGHGGDVTQAFCETPATGWVTTTGDCADTDLNVYPGAKEVKDGKDNDCDGNVDGLAMGMPEGLEKDADLWVALLEGALSKLSNFYSEHPGEVFEEIQWGAIINAGARKQGAKVKILELLKNEALRTATWEWVKAKLQEKMGEEMESWEMDLLLLTATEFEQRAKAYDHAKEQKYREKLLADPSCDYKADDFHQTDLADYSCEHRFVHYDPTDKHGTVDPNRKMTAAIYRWVERGVPIEVIRKLATMSREVVAIQRAEGMQ